MNNTTNESRNNKSNYTTAAAIGTVAGLAVGLGAGMMLAPRSGKNTRDKIKQNFREVQSKIDRKASSIKNKVNSAKEDTKKAIRNSEPLQASNSKN